MKPTALPPAISLRIICGNLLVLTMALAPSPTFAQRGARGGHVGVATPGTARPGVVGPEAVGPGVVRPRIFEPGVVGAPRAPMTPFHNSVAPYRVFPPRRRRYFPIIPIVGFPGFYGLGYNAFWVSDCDGFWGWGYGCGTVSPLLADVLRSDDLPDGSPPAETPPTDNFAADGGVVAQLPRTILLYLKDGSVFAVTKYTVSDGKLHYATAYGGRSDIDLDILDLQKTVDENAARGVTFTLTAPNPDSVNPGSATPGS